MKVYRLTFSFQSPSMLSLRGPEMEERADRLPPIRQDLVLVTHHIQIHIIIRRGAVIAIYPHTHPRYPLIIRRGTNSSNGAALEASQGVSPGWACQLQRGGVKTLVCYVFQIQTWTRFKEYCVLLRDGSWPLFFFKSKTWVWFLRVKGWDSKLQTKRFCCFGFILDLLTLPPLY